VGAGRSDIDAGHRAALDAAVRATERGDLPRGAAVEIDGAWFARHDERRSSGDPTAHAVALALVDATSVRGTWRLDGARIVVTHEPCLLCAGALVAARVATLVYACANPVEGAAGSIYNVCADPRLGHEVTVEVVPPSSAFAQACAALERLADP
jgi:tRNA(adenine34) deaminase